MSTATAAKNNQASRVIAPHELSAVVILMRQARQWSQEQLADVSGLTARTIQRVERGEPSSTDTRRALARAFEADDIDCFNKPQTPLSAEEMQADREKLEREMVTLAMSPATGRTLAELGESSQADLFHAAAELPREAAEVFAALTDYWREYRDACDLYSEVDKLEVHDEFQSRLDELKALSFSLRLGERVVTVRPTKDEDASPFKVRVAYVVAFPMGKEPDEIRTPRAFQFNL